MLFMFSFLYHFTEATMINTSGKVGDKEEDFKKQTKDSLHKIEDELAEGGKFSFRSVASVWVSSVGLGVISIALGFYSVRQCTNALIFGVLLGLIMFILGGGLLFDLYSRHKFNK